MKIPNWVRGIAMRMAVRALVGEIRHLDGVAAACRAYRAEGTLGQIVGVYATVTPRKTDDVVARGIDRAAVLIHDHPLSIILEGIHPDARALADQIATGILGPPAQSK